MPDLKAIMEKIIAQMKINHTVVMEKITENQIQTEYNVIIRNITNRLGLE